MKSIQILNTYALLFGLDVCQALVWKFTLLIFEETSILIQETLISWGSNWSPQTNVEGMISLGCLVLSRYQKHFSFCIFQNPLEMKTFLSKYIYIYTLIFDIYKAPSLLVGHDSLGQTKLF